MLADIYGLLRRYEFNKTEPETLIGLVEEAIAKGETTREEQTRLRNVSAELLSQLRDMGMILSSDLEGVEELLNECTAGVDGSCQPIGGVGGKWWVPLSCALVVFERGVLGEPTIEVEAHIEVIQEEEFSRVGARSSELMLNVETKAIMRWAMRDKPSILFIDGPIIDPPLCTDVDYIRYRCSAVKECLKRQILVVGCAKRFRGSHLKKHLKTLLRRSETKIDLFPSDLQLVAFVFAHYWRQDLGTGEGVYTYPLDVSEATDVHRLYLENGIRVFSTFVQKSLREYILRLDVPFIDTGSLNEDELLSKVAQAVKAALSWTYPGQNIPLPVFLADAKCEIRRGCAEVLYEEIMTRSRTADPIDQIVALQLEARV
ncbi:MAG: DNA double-strand break repair nuclease NurA [Candidatus Methanomethyliaceae archaeon]